MVEDDIMVQVLFICCKAFRNPRHEIRLYRTFVLKYKPKDHWSCIAHLSAEDMLKSAVIEEKTTH